RATVPRSRAALPGARTRGRPILARAHRGDAHLPVPLPPGSRGSHPPRIAKFVGALALCSWALLTSLGLSPFHELLEEALLLGRVVWRRLGRLGARNRRIDLDATTNGLPLGIAGQPFLCRGEALPSAERGAEVCLLPL